MSESNNDTGNYIHENNGELVKEWIRNFGEETSYKTATKNWMIWYDNIQTHLREVGCVGGRWMDLV
jgi:hypothetical protein